MNHVLLMERCVPILSDINLTCVSCDRLRDRMHSDDLAVKTGRFTSSALLHLVRYCDYGEFVIKVRYSAT